MSEISVTSLQRYLAQLFRADVELDCDRDALEASAEKIIEVMRRDGFI